MSAHRIIASTPAQDLVREIPVVTEEERNVVRIELMISGEGDLEQAVASSIRTLVDDEDVTLVGSRSRQAIELGGGVEIGPDSHGELSCPHSHDQLSPPAPIAICDRASSDPALSPATLSNSTG